MGVYMMWKRGNFVDNYANFHVIINEWLTIRNPRELAANAAERKPTMHLLPYGIPICIGSIGYFLYEGMLIG